jgi:hypothetical protein
MTKSKIGRGRRPVKSRTMAEMNTRRLINPPLAAAVYSSPAPLHRVQPAPVKIATITYCGMASSHHFTSTSPRDSDAGYSTSSRAG